MSRRSSVGERSTPPLTVACQALALLGAEGTSLGLAVGLAMFRARLPAYVARNELSVDDRNLIVVLIACGASLFVVVGLAALARRWPGSASSTRLMALRLSPLLLSGLVPLLLSRWVWVGRDLVFLVLTALFTLGTYASMRASSTASERSIGRWLPHLLGRPTRPAFALVTLGAVGYAVFFSYHTIVHHRNLHSTSFDLGIFDNLMWNLVHGGPLFKASPALGPEGSHLARHATFVAYALAPAYALWPAPETLLAIQAVLVGAAAIPLFLFARRHVGSWAGCLLAGAYLLYPPVHGANLYDFHFLTIAPVFLWLSLHLLEARRDRLAALAIAVTLSVREDVAVGVAILGAYLVLSGERPRAGLVVAAVAVAYVAAVRGVIMPSAGQAPFFLSMYRGLVPPSESDFLGVLRTVLTNPAYTIGSLLEPDKLVYVLQILLPLAFLPLLRPLGLLFCVPGFLFTLLATGYAPLVQISFQYTAHWTAFMFPAAVLGLAWVAPASTADAPAVAVTRRTWLAALAVATVVCTYQYGAVLQQGIVRGGFGPYRFGTTSADVVRRDALRDLLRELPARAKVVATERLVPQVSGRPDAYTLRVGVFDAQYALFPVRPSELIWPAEGKTLRRLLSSGDFGVMATRGPFALARRGYSTAGNRAVLANLRR